MSRHIAGAESARIKLQLTAVVLLYRASSVVRSEFKLLEFLGCYLLSGNK